MQPVLRYAKPRPKKPVNEQGVPIRQRPLPEKPKRKPRQSVPDTFDLVSDEERSTPDTPTVKYPNVDPSPAAQAEYEDQIRQSGPPQVPDEPAAPVDLNQPFPATDLGVNTLGLLDPNGDFGGIPASQHGSGAHHFAESLSMGGVYPKHEAAQRALEVVQGAHAAHNPDGGRTHIHSSSNSRSPLFSGIPVGYVKLAPKPAGKHDLIVHYPQGNYTVYREPFR